MSKLLNRGKGSQGAPEVYTARSQLEGVLQNLVEKQEESPLKDEIKDEPEPLLDVPLTPSKRNKHYSKQSRKRKRHDESDEEEPGQYHHTYVMKLYDRSVNLAQFEANAPLYAVCRAWMKNSPHTRDHTGTGSGSRRGNSPGPDMDTSDDDSDAEADLPVYSLPPPVMTMETEGGDLRIPSPLPHPPDELSLDEVYSDPLNQPNPEQLLMNHMFRWRQIRQKWKEASRRNDARYTASLTVLKDMYDRACKD